MSKQDHWSSSTRDSKYEAMPRFLQRLKIKYGCLDYFQYMSCTEDRKKLIQTYSEMLIRLQSVIVQVLDNELINWKREQQLAGNGHSVNTATLELLQNWCDSLATVVWTMRKQLKQLEELVNKVPDQQNCSQDLKILIAKVTELLSNLVTG